MPTITLPLAGRWHRVIWSDSYNPTYAGAYRAFASHGQTDIPAGARITAASLNANANTDSVVRVFGYAVDSPPATWGEPVTQFDSGSINHAMPLTAASSNPLNVASVVQEVINRPGFTGWMALIWYHTLSPSSDFVVTSGNYLPSSASTLTVTYDEPATITHSVSQTGSRTARFAASIAGGEWDPLTSSVWAHGDGTTSTDLTSTHTYAAAGSYSWTLTLTFTSGRIVTRTGTVTVDDYPQATLALTRSGKTVTATITTTLAPDTTATASIDWGDGTTSTSLTHTYGVGGSYVVRATITDSRGYTALATASVTLADARLRATTVGLTVHLDASITLPLAGRTITAWHWTHGDGTSSTGVRSTHMYATPGTYLVTLTVTDSADEEASRSAQVEVTPWMDADDAPTVWADVLTRQVRTVSVVAELLAPDRDFVIPWGQRVPVRIGDVTCDGTTLARWSSQLEVIDPAWIPRTPTDPLHHLARTWVRLWWMIAADDTTWIRTPIGTYRIGVPAVSDRGIVESISPLDDPLVTVRRALWGNRGLNLSGLDAAEAVARILTDRAAWLPVEWTPAGTMLPTGYQVGTPEGDPLADVEKIADAHGLDVHTDPMGVVQVHPARRTPTTSAVWAHGHGCTITAWTAETDPADLCNQATVWSTASTVAPVSATVSDEDNASPLWVGHGVIYGKAEGSAEVSTREQCEARARQLLSNGRASVRALDVTARANPALMPGDLATATHPHLGVTGMYQITKWTLTVAQPEADEMTIDAIEYR